MFICTTLQRFGTGVSLAPCPYLYAAISKGLMTDDFEPLSDTTRASSYQATFSHSVKAEIRATYDRRCVICLNCVDTSQCAHIIDAATGGRQQVGTKIAM
jgi:predicted restriction endonuclease